jgi:hypothetical protein
VGAALGGIGVAVGGTRVAVGVRVTGGAQALKTTASNRTNVVVFMMVLLGFRARQLGRNSP